MRQEQPIELECRPVLKDTICRFGEKCFHNIHYLCRTEKECRKDKGFCIPEDACPFDGMVSNLEICDVKKVGNCV